MNTFWWIVLVVFAFWLGVNFTFLVKGSVTSLYRERLTRLMEKYLQIAGHTHDGRIDVTIVIQDLQRMRGGLQDADRPARG